MPKQPDYTVSRTFASDILNVSIRTLDRYTKKKHITSVRRGRNLFFSEGELLEFKAKIMAEKELKERKELKELKDGGNRVKLSRAGRSEEAPPVRSRRTDDFEDVRDAQVIEQTEPLDATDVEFSLIRDQLLRRSPEEGIFKRLYEQAEVSLKELRSKFELANYTVGQLEAQVKSMVPMLEYKKQKDELLLLADENKMKKEDIQQLERDVRVEMFAKKFYAAMLWGMVCLIPLLLILRLVAG